jgi:hypothetical protein
MAARTESDAKKVRRKNFVARMQDWMQKSTDSTRTKMSLVVAGLLLLHWSQKVCRRKKVTKFFPPSSVGPQAFISENEFTMYHHDM